jgi:hypothetical protein
VIYLGKLSSKDETLQPFNAWSADVEVSKKLSDESYGAFVSIFSAIDLPN